MAFAPLAIPLPKLGGVFALADGRLVMPSSCVLQDWLRGIPDSSFEDIPADLPDSIFAGACGNRGAIVTVESACERALKSIALNPAGRSPRVFLVAMASIGMLRLPARQAAHAQASGTVSP